MPLPPKGDPRRQLHLAVRSSRLLGILFVLFGLCGSFAFVAPRFTGGGIGVSTILGMIVVGFYFLPGIGYLVFSSYLSNYRPWAVTATLVIACIHTLLVLLAAAGAVLRAGALAGADGSPAGFVVIGVILFVLLALGQMIYHLVQSYEAVRHPPFGREDTYQGFSPVFPATPPVDPREVQS